jgi:cytochrome c-type biogenesis protein CcmH
MRTAGSRAAAAAAVLAGAALLICSSALAAAPRASLPHIEDEVMCPICGTLLEFSESPQADRERALIRRLIDQGRSKDQIEDELVAEYGPQVLAEPSSSGFDLTAWLVPGLGIAIALGLIVLAAVRLRRRGPAAPEPAELDPSDLARLERDMSSREPR